MATLVLSCFPCFRFFDTVLYQMVTVGNDLLELFFYKKRKKEEENCIDISCNCPKVLNKRSYSLRKMLIYRWQGKASIETRHVYSEVILSEKC